MVERKVKPILVHVTTVPWSFFFFRGQTEFMKSHGFDFRIISSPDERLDQFGAREQVETYGVSMARQITPLRDIGALGRLITTLLSVRPSIVHAHTPKGGLLGMIAAWIARVPIRIYHIRGLPYMTATGHKRKLLTWSERVSCLLANQVLCVSNSILDVAIEDGICSPDKIKVLGAGSGNGVDASVRFNPNRFSKTDRDERRNRYGIAADARVIGYIGRLVRDKGIEELAAAWSLLESRFPDTHLLLVGPIEPQDPVSPASLEALRSHPRVHFVDDIEDPAPYYSLFDIVVLPTYREGFPNVPLEAAAMKLPVVATRVPGCIDAVADGDTGTLVPSQDAASLSEAIARYLDDSGLRQVHGEAGRQRVLNEFRQEDVWEALYEEYLRLMDERGLTFQKSD
jgi:glycosyltransferase involved in cell wall biosynthesis